MCACNGDCGVVVGLRCGEIARADLDYYIENRKSVTKELIEVCKNW